MSEKIKADGYTRKTVRLRTDAYKKIEKVSGGNFNRWIGKLIEQEFDRDGGESLGQVTEQEIQSEKLDKVMDENLLKIMNTEGEAILRNLPKIDLAKLIAQRAPKALALDYDHEKAVLSLKAALSRMPGSADLHKELVKVKGDYRRLEIEYNVQVASIRGLRKVYGELSNGRENYEAIRDLCREIAKEGYALREEDELRDMITNGIRVLGEHEEIKHAEI